MTQLQLGATTFVIKKDRTHTRMALTQIIRTFVAGFGLLASSNASAQNPHLLALGKLLSAWSVRAEDQRLAWMDMDRSTLQVAVELASETAALSSTDRGDIFDALHYHVVVARAERVFAAELLSADPEQEFTVLVAAERDRPLDYLFAARRSYARLRAVEQAGERDWISRQHTAAKKYVTLAAEDLRRWASENEAAAAMLQTRPYAIRRPAHEAERVVEQLKRDGLSEEHRKLLGESGLTPEGVAAYQQKVLSTPATEIGISVVELWQRMAESRRQLANQLDNLAGDRRQVSRPLGDSFLVGNPHDRDALVVLVVRRVAMPPEWTISLSEVESTAAEKPAKRLREVEKGKRYEIRLPAKGEIRVVSEVTPVGEMAENTTARWAIEGRIGEELIGGLVQEVNVPGFLPDLQLPPIAPPSQATAGAPSVWRNHLLWMIIAGLFLAIAIAVVVLRARKRA